MPISKAAHDVDVSQLRSGAAGHFFRTTTKLTDAAVKKLFQMIVKEWAQGAPLAREIRKTRDLNGNTYNYSFLCIKLKPTEPPFLPGSGLKENSYGFVLLVEIDGIVGLFKRGPSGLEDWVNSACDPIETRTLTRVFGAKATYGKLSLRRMTISQHELRACSYEAADLSTTIPALGLGRSIPRFIRLNHRVSNRPPETISITPGTARITLSGKKLTVDGLAAAVARIAQQVATVPKQGFLDAFPIPIDLSCLPAGVSPTGLLFDLSPINATSDNSGANIILTQAGKPDSDVTNTMKARFAEVLAVRIQAGAQVFGNGLKAVRGALIRNSRVFSIKLRSHLNLVVRDADGNDTPFPTWIRQTQCFSVCFSSPEYFYTHGQLYQRADFVREVEVVKSVLETKRGLVGANSEKGPTKTYTNRTRRFDPNSIFAFVETVLCRSRKHLWCCDLGDEWADYIVFDSSRGGGDIQFLHCKHGDETCGASAFQEVIGQALKNLGRAQVSPGQLLEKMADLRARPNWGSSGIPRYRGNGSLERDAEGLLGRPDARRTVAVVVTMFSKQGFVAEAAKTPLEPHFVQLVWLLASFVNSCREMGAKAVIVCKP